MSSFASCTIIFHNNSHGKETRDILYISLNSNLRPSVLNFTVADRLERGVCKKDQIKIKLLF
jgi:hypothetical protein